MVGKGMELALVLIGPIALLAILTARRASRRSSPFVAALQADDGPWVVAIMGLWGALTKRPFKLWHGLGLESLVVAVVFAALGVGAWFLIEKPRVGANAIGPLCLWAITGTIAQLLGSEASDVAMHMRLANLADAPRLYAVIAFLIALVCATWSSPSR